MRETLTTALDVIAVLCVAGGLVAAGWPWIGAAGFIPAGLLIGGVSAVWAHRARGGAA